MRLKSIRMKKIAILIFILFTAQLYAQKKTSYDSGEKKASSAGGGSGSVSLAGNWQGVLTQPGGGLADNYAFWITFKQTKDSIKGFSRLEISNTNNFGILEFKGIVKGNEITIQETKITDENIQYGAFWCIKAYTLSYDAATGSLTGNWIAPKGCGPGKIFLYRSAVAFNRSKAHTNVYLTYDDLKSNVKAAVKVMGKKVVMSELVFEDGKAELNETSKKYLDNLALFLKENPKLSIKILGHTDISGDDFANFTLSMNRAKAVAEYLKAKGIKSTRLHYEGFGETRPMRDNSTENGRMKNRRIEFEVISE